ncbi:hypothetical protein CAPTEDRAFT_19638 [Capitella teleta]|uniref:AB hydrolase-1 domain-containing protein n=1 Tax=Capitella teleta TaxID=283909 RepID=R7U8R1_CAPTE|nr:hypothetical protein CAPTEDRAFT_19638 [Capitella teleta]|eukprot:ELU02364.1 hypothetical protein CAPTEDRAFT_19638 [Capitella teleta]
MVKLKPVLQIVFYYSVGLFYVSILGVLATIKTLITLGPRKTFFCQRRDRRPDVLDDPLLGEHKFARMKKGDQNKPLMLFVHGFPEFWYSWRHQMSEFSDTHRCVAVDMRGYNESDKPIGVENYALDLMAADIKELVEYLGHDKCTLVSHDWGGLVANCVAETYPEIVQTLITCNGPNGRAMMKVLHKSLAQFLKSWYVFAFQWPMFAEYLIRLGDLTAFDGNFTSNKEDVLAYKHAFRDYGDLEGPVNYYRALGRYMLPDAPEKVHVRSLIIWGTADAALDIQIPEATREYFDDLTIEYVDGGSHWIQNEKPKEVNQLIRQFISAKKED